MEKYSKHLEKIVADRTADLELEKAKTDKLLYSKYCKWIQIRCIVVTFKKGYEYLKNGVEVECIIGTWKGGYNKFHCYSKI